MLFVTYRNHYIFSWHNYCVSYGEMKILKKPIILNKRPISELLIEGYERTSYVQPEGDTCGFCGSSNTLRWHLRKLVFMFWVHKQAIECKDCVWESVMESIKTPKKKLKRALLANNSNLDKFKALSRDLQMELLKKSGVI